MLASSKTLVCASLAKSGRTSNAPFMHNTAFKHLELDYVYVSFEPDNIGEAVKAVRALGLPGGSVSTPYKQSIIEHLDRLDETAKAIGAVNSYKNEGGKIVGYNSDWIGAMEALEEVANINGKKVAVIGAGGVARAIVFGLIDRGALVTIFNRTAENGEKLAKDFDVTFGGGLSDIKGYEPQILINATSLGKNNGEGLSVDLSVFKEAEAVLDVTSSPLVTGFLSDAAQNGCKTVGGLRMSVLQAAFTFELITGHKAPIEIMYETALSTIKSN